VASGGVWKTDNAGTTWSPIFDSQASYSIGTVVLDPKDPNIVWVGSGENNAQRAVAFGDGVYKSEDGGRTWKNMGLKQSEHIGRIVIDPRDSKVIFVAAQGPLWAEGGDRGLFKSTDGGETWTKLLSGEKYAGVNDISLDPRNPDVMVASTWQRHRQVWGYLAGGPESALHRSTDGGKTWKKLSGVPEGEGRIGLARSSSHPDIVYALVEASNNRGGVYRSSDNGVSWERRGGQPGKDAWFSGVNTSREAMEAIKSGRLTALAGGHFIVGAWAIVMLYDYHRGRDFAREEGLELDQSMFTLFSPADADRFLKRYGDLNFDQVDFRHFSKVLNPSLKRYDFNFLQLLR